MTSFSFSSPTFTTVGPLLAPPGLDRQNLSASFCYDNHEDRSVKRTICAGIKARAMWSGSLA
jgi:hypothetical protein